MDDFDVVVDALQKHRDRLWDMINRNMKSEYASLNIMDDIRFYQIEQLDEAIMARKNKKEWQGLTDEEVKILATQGRTDFSRPGYNEFYSAIEAKLKEKNT
jgi:hypothetical protein